MKSDDIQRDHINSEINHHERQKELSSVIQKKYEKYVSDGNENDFNMLIGDVDSYCIFWIRKNLWKIGCYSDDNVMNILQEGRLAVWKILEQDKETNVLRDEFAPYVFKIYENKTMDAIRKIVRERVKYNFVSIDEKVGEKETPIIEYIPSNEDIDPALRNEQQLLFGGMFVLYCSSLVNAEVFPPMSLALYYARILPHLLHDINDSKGASAKWAFDHIGKRKIKELKTDSEDFMSTNVDNTLKWCLYFNERLLEIVPELGKKEQLKDIVYAEVYDKCKIEDWSEYMHKLCARKLFEAVYSDEKLSSLAEEYIGERDRLRKCVKKGKAK